MGWLKPKQTLSIDKWHRFQYMLKASFSRLRSDINNLVSWVQYFQGKHEDVDTRLSRIENYMHLPQQDINKIHARIGELEKSHIMPKYELEKVNMRIDRLEEHNERKITKDDVEVIVGRHSAFENMLAKMQEMEARIANIELNKATPKQNLREKIVRNITRNSKEYVKNLIRNLILKYERISGLQMKEMVVDEQGLCSKSSFYRILQEVEEEGQVGFLREGKEKKYFAKAGKIKSFE
ncbi:hypothetical protein KY330_01280 [Candidatus Woesearchaeota archaeon]|nr:hypothetical protein [Candidatus Woesearchaeota archaeon]